MKYLVSASEMRRYDSNAIEKIKIPACVLMERAALAVADIVVEHCSKTKDHRRILIMAGMGNNGGDGLAAARLLAEKGYAVDVWCVGDREKASVQWKQQREILENYPVQFVRTPKPQGYPMMSDALFGIGLSREVGGIFAEAIDVFCSGKGWKLSMDIPSGIDSDTGRIWGHAVKADMTVTFGFCKKGLALYPGCGYAGEIRVADIGISERSFFGKEPEMYAYDEDAALVMPGRSGDGNKSTFGKVLLIAGSENMAGAAVLAARAAYRAGAGMVKVISSAENRIILQCAVPEALFGSSENLVESMEWADVIALGPGIGKNGEALSCLEQAIAEGKKPLLMDADGLNLLAEHQALKSQLAKQGMGGRDIILTPHVGELSRLLGRSIAECKGDLAGYGKELAETLHATVAAKDARTFICKERHALCLNLSGNSGMATAGSGDVLAGIIAAFLAQGMEAFDAAAAGVYVHGRAGDHISARIGEHACMAGDIAMVCVD